MLTSSRMCYVSEVTIIKLIVIPCEVRIVVISLRLWNVMVTLLK